ncbi:MAG: hypothetical protein KatS3mg076_2675 [Candidatus Binatia bacterium]|nr:MAG: hypothetical protein KatS3mg076_2675 [Candidatus Binatia bacterium]
MREARSGASLLARSIMSVAVAVRARNEIVLATDTLTCFGSRRVPPQNHRAVKIREIGQALMASTGWGIYENLFDDFLSGRPAPELRDSKAIFAFFNRFWRALHTRYSLVNEQCNSKDSPFGDLDSTFLVVNPNGIFCVESDMSVTQFRQYYAIGSGANYSLGALHVLYDPEGDPELLARRAVEAAIALDTGCGGEILLRRLRAAPPRRGRPGAPSRRVRPARGRARRTGTPPGGGAVRG